MQENNQIDIDKKDDFLREVEELKKKYKSTKAKLAWVDDNFEEGLIEEEMDKYATQIRALKQKLAQIESSETKV